MARPRKRTVDYFPHYCVHGKTMFILEQKYGNDGYAFWFKLLEKLGRADGHYIDLNDDISLEFLGAETRLSVGLSVEILGLLARIEAIDKELWQKSRIIWCQNFVDGIADAYNERKDNLPIKPVSPPINEVSPPINEVITPKSGGETHKLNKTRIYINKPKNQKPQKTTIPENFTISEQVKAWAESKSYKNLELHLEAFIDVANAKAYEYVDWDSAFKKAIRENWGKINSNTSDRQTKPNPEKGKLTEEEYKQYLELNKIIYMSEQQANDWQSLKAKRGD